MTKEKIAKELGGKYEEYLLKTDELKVYANHEWFKYQWCDLRQKKYSDVYKNEMFDTRIEFKEFLIKHIDKLLVSE